MPRLIHLMAASALAVPAATGPAMRTPATTPARAVEELIGADRAYAAAASSRNAVDAIGAFLAPDVAMSAPGDFAHGRDAAIAQLRANPVNLTGRLTWAPVRGGISADGRHGFTFGFMTLARADSPSVPLKYLAYWVKGPEGWKAATYRRVRRPPGEVPTAMRPPLLPEGMIPVVTDPATLARHEKELGDAERAFSDLAGKIGVGPAFFRNGAADAMNMGGAENADFVYGPAAISALVGSRESGPSKLTWGPDHRVIVASSGDLGVTIGHIVVPGQGNEPPQRVPFFTIWRKDPATGTWKYVAE